MADDFVEISIDGPATISTQQPQQQRRETALRLAEHQPEQLADQLEGVIDNRLLRVTQSSQRDQMHDLLRLGQWLHRTHARLQQCTVEQVRKEAD